MSIEQTLFNPDDPRLTAYALGELSDPAERAQVEELLAASPEARAELADIRSLTAALTAEYEQERFAAAEETVAANVVQMPRPFWRRRSLGAIAALLVVGGLAGLLGVLSIHIKEARTPRFGVTNSLQVRDEHAHKVNRAAPVAATPSSPLLAMSDKAAESQRQARLNGSATDASSLVFPAAPLGPIRDDSHPLPGATPSSRLLAQSAQPVLKAELVADPDVRELIVPMDAPTPPNLPSGTEVARGPAPVSGVVGGNASASGTGGGSPLLFAKNKEARDSFISDKDMDNSSSSGVDAEKSAPAQPGSPLIATAAPAPAPSNGAIGSASPYTGTSTVTPGAGVVTGARGQIRVKQQPKKPFALSFNDAPVPPGIGSGKQLGGGGTVGTGIPAEPDMVEPGSVVSRRLARDKAEQQHADTADYVHTVENAFLGAKENPLSTFSIDVDTASYAIVRRFIEAGSLPPVDAVRVEEMLNYFPYDDAPPAPDSDKPFAVHLEAAACPWNVSHRLVRIGLKGKEMTNEKRPPSNLVFLLDVSGSMMPEERLPLIKRSLRLMVDKLREDDHVAIVVYAGESGLAMPPTSGDHKDAILSAIENLHAGGSTNGASGIKLAYNVARKAFIKGGTNRVILATDGDFNVGVTNRGDLLRLIEDERKDGVFLSVLGVGTDNLKDSTMQTLADHGNGNYNYIDRLEEGRKVLVNQMSGTLVTIAKDVKIQVEFNPAAVASYRLIGYEKRMLKKEDFNNDKIDAGEIGAGHNVTALYEVVPRGQPGGGTGEVDGLKYQPTPTPDPSDAVASRAYVGAPLNELLTVKMRHKAPDSDTSERSYEVPLLDRGAPEDFANASTDFRFAAAVASFGMVLRDSSYKGNATLGSALELAQASKGEDAGSYRAGFIDLVKQAQGLQRERGR